MPRKAFLKKKSLLDRFKDDYATHTGYIQSARAKHTWNNPLTRRKRTKELNKWIKSFAGKNHIHKLARFNATNAGRYESMYNETMSLKGFLENLTEKLTKQFDLDLEEVQAYLNSHTQEMQELLNDTELSLKEKVLFVRSEITGEKDEKKSEFYMDGDDSEDYYYCHRCGRVTPSYELDAHGGFCSDCDARWTAEHENESKDTDEKLGYEKGHKNSRGEDAPWVIRSHEDNRVLASFANTKDAEEHLQRMKQYSKTESKNESNKNDVEQKIIRIFEKLSKENKSISQFIDMEEIKDNIEELREIFWDSWADDNFENGHFVWHIDANREDDEEADMWNGIATFITDEVLELLDIPNDGKPSQNWIDLQEYLFYEVFEKVYDYSDDEDGSADESKKSETKDRLAGYKPYSFKVKSKDPTTLKNDAEAVLNEFAEDVADNTTFKFEYDWYDKSWELIDTENNVVFMKGGFLFKDFADAPLYLDDGISEKPAGMRLRSWMTYSDEDNKSEAHNLKNYTSNIISKLDGIYACGLNGAKRLAEKYADVIQQNYTDGDLSTAETAKFIAGQENLTESRKKTESKQSEVHLELIDTIIVPKWLWEAHTFGNEYGEDLDEHEQEILAKFEEEYGKQYYLDDRSEEADFRSRNDFDEYGGPCYEVDVYKMS